MSMTESLGASSKSGMLRTRQYALARGGARDAERKETSRWETECKGGLAGPRVMGRAAAGREEGDTAKKLKNRWAGLPLRDPRCLLRLVLVFGWALAAGPAALAGTAASPLPPRPAAVPVAPGEQRKQPQDALQSVSSFLASLPPAARAGALQSHASPHAMLRDAHSAQGAPATARMRCLVAGQIHGVRGQAPGGGDSGGRPRSSARGSSLEEEVRRSGSCILGFGANDAGQLALGHDRSTRVPQLVEGVPAYLNPAPSSGTRHSCVCVSVYASMRLRHRPRAS